MPDKEGSDDEKKSTKGVVNKKQKQMMNQEQLDLSSVAESFGGQIVGEPVILNEIPAILALPAVGAAIFGTGAVGYDSYQKLRGKKGILPDLTPVVKGVGDTFNKVKGIFKSKSTTQDKSGQIEDPWDEDDYVSGNKSPDSTSTAKSGPKSKGTTYNKDIQQELPMGGEFAKSNKKIKKKRSDIGVKRGRRPVKGEKGKELEFEPEVSLKDRIIAGSIKNKKLIKNKEGIKTPPKKEIEKIKPKNTKKKTDTNINRNIDRDSQIQTQTKSSVGNNALKIGGATALVTGINNLTNKNKTNKKIPTVNKTKKAGAGGKLPGIRFPGTAHIVGRRSNPQ
tara:strand:+ start:219 stop:1226 length:1008 start_codon:yes stop_codon:yes gene_type:complete